MLELLLTAIAYSSGIAIGAAGITMIYMATGTFNFAHASMVAWGFYVVFSLYSLYGGSPYYYMPLAALFSGLLGVLIYLTVNRRLLRARASMVTLMMSTLGVELILFAFINVFADYLTATYKLPARYFVLSLEDVKVSVAGLEVAAIKLVAPAVVVLTIVLLQLFLTRTKFGVAVRATIENPELASVLGINPEIVYMTAWFIGGALAGLSGALLSMVISGYPAVGMGTIVTFFAGAIVGGLYSVFGSLLGGFLIGMSEQVGIFVLSQQIGGEVIAFKPAIPLVIMAITLLIYPRGLGGIDWSKLKRLVPGVRR